MNDDGVVDHGKSWTFSGGEAAPHIRADRPRSHSRGPGNTVNRTLPLRGAGEGEGVELTAYFPGDVPSVSAADAGEQRARVLQAPVDLDAVRLATSEIVTNAVVHAGGVSRSPCG